MKFEVQFERSSYYELHNMFISRISSGRTESALSQKRFDVLKRVFKFNDTARPFEHLNVSINAPSLTHTSLLDTNFFLERLQLNLTNFNSGSVGWRSLQVFQLTKQTKKGFIRNSDSEYEVDSANFSGQSDRLAISDKVQVP